MSVRDEALTAQRRFGFGPLAGGAATVAGDPRGYVLAELGAPPTPDDSGLGSSADLYRELQARLRQGNVAKAAGDPSLKDLARDKGTRVRALYLDEVGFAQRRAVAAENPLIERLVLFWSGHFCISCAKSEPVKFIGGAYEREAIRPYVTGRFRDMLGAVMHHAAMLLYLDNQSSVGPNSTYALKRKGSGLNENLGRELLELHTVGVHAGYTQDDVTDAARILTGWSVAPGQATEGPLFAFYKERHEPGSFTVMGRSYAEAGEEQGEALLDDLAAHPATARHVAGKLVRHFVGDRAPATRVFPQSEDVRPMDDLMA